MQLLLLKCNCVLNVIHRTKIEDWRLEIPYIRRFKGELF